MAPRSHGNARSTLHSFSRMHMPSAVRFKGSVPVASYRLVKTFREQALTHAAGSDQQISGDALASIRRLRRRGIQFSTAALCAALAGGTLSGVLPGIPYGTMLPAIAAIASAVMLYVGALSLQNDGQLHCVWHSGWLHIEGGVPPSGVDSSTVPQLEDDAVTVKWADDLRGYGVFATQDIIRGTFIGNYEGELMNLSDYYEKYSDGMSNYCITIDEEWVIDGSTRSANHDCFSPCHINHSKQRFNVARRTLPKKKVVEFYVLKDIKRGDELLLDYGRKYWKNREELELP